MSPSIESRTGSLVELLVESARLVHPGGDLELLVSTLLRGALEAFGAAQVILVLTESGPTRLFRAVATRPELEVESVGPTLWTPAVSAQPRTGPVDENLRRAVGVARSGPARLASFQFAGGEGCLVVEGVGAEAEEELSPLARHAGNLIGNLRACQATEVEARTDGLTGAMNYRHFMRRVSDEIERARAQNETFALLMVDVDNLKTYNDRYGHLGGSAALKELARLLEESTRAGDVVAKYGGDEFSVLLPDTTVEAALRYCHDILERVERHRFEGDPYRRLTISVGLALFPEDGAGPRELLRQADDRLYRAKADGRNRIGIAHSRVIVRT
jgi:diguanylate cyclase (GGDEF)-like protein